MISSFNVSLAGLNAAAKRLQVSATNIANQFSTATIKDGQLVNEPYKAQRAQQVSNNLGGVSVVVRDANPPTVTAYAPGSPNADANGQAEIPNVSMEDEFINQMIASYDYKANLKAIQTQNHLFENLLDIKS
jgi:flagellar basal-body rod protein FlgC